MLQAFDDVEEFVGLSTDFVLRTQDDLVGGLAKWADNATDSLHTYLGLSGLALAGHQGLRRVEPSVNLTARALDD
jgi:geranylgeranyl transferase type-1 subunit beta